MRRRSGHLLRPSAILAIFAASVSVGRAQDVVVHDATPAFVFHGKAEMTTFVTYLRHGDENALRFVVTHQHSFTVYGCSGYLYVSRHHVAYDPVFSPESKSDGFDFNRSEVVEAKYSKPVGHNIKIIDMRLKDRRLRLNVLFEGPGGREVYTGKEAETVYKFFDLVADHFDEAEATLQEKSISLLPELAKAGNKDALLKIREMSERGEGPFQRTTAEVRAGEASERIGQMRNAFEEYLAALRDLPEWAPPDVEDSLRQRIIVLVLKLNPTPVIPEEARHHANFAATALDMAKDQPQQLDGAIHEWNETLRFAPWWPEVYFNAGLVLEKRGRYSEAERYLKLYLLAAPNAPDVDAVRQKIDSLEYKAQQQARQ